MSFIISHRSRVKFIGKETKTENSLSVILNLNFLFYFFVGARYLFGGFRRTIWLIGWMSSPKSWMTLQFAIDAQNDGIRSKIHMKSRQQKKSLKLIFSLILKRLFLKFLTLSNFFFITHIGLSRYCMLFLFQRFDVIIQ